MMITSWIRLLVRCRHIFADTCAVTVNMKHKVFYVMRRQRISDHYAPIRYRARQLRLCWTSTNSGTDHIIHLIKAWLCTPITSNYIYIVHFVELSFVLVRRQSRRELTDTRRDPIGRV